MLNRFSPVDPVLQALSEPSRRAIVELVASRPCSVSELAHALEISVPGTMQHLSVLDRADLIETEKIGRVRTVRLKAGGLRALETWAETLRATWEVKLDHLGAYLAETAPEDERK